MPEVHPTPVRTESDAALSHLDQLPTLPSVVVRVLQITADSSSGARDLVQLLRADQSLTAKILSIASAPALAARPVRTLEQAVPLLGMAAVRNIVLSASVFDVFKKSSDVSATGGFQQPAFWTHALAVGCAARELARRNPACKVDPDNAYIAGLLHDLGKVALSTVFPKAYDRIAAAAVEERGDIADFERDALGADHARAGRRVAELWKLPDDLVEVIWLHHFSLGALPPSVRHPQLIGLVQLADTIAREQRLGFSGNFRFFANAQELGAQLGFSVAQLEAAAATLVSETTDLAGHLGLDRDPPERVFVRAMGQANAELGRINSQLTTTNRRLESAARFFNAMSEFDRQIGPWSELSVVIEKMLHTAMSALDRKSLAVLGVGEDKRTVEAAWISESQFEGCATIEEVPPDFQEWCRTPLSAPTANLMRTPTAVRRLLAGTPALRGTGADWFAPICQNDLIVGGILFLTPPQEDVNPPQDCAELRAFLNGFGLAITRANAQAAARRLTDDLADANRNLQKTQNELLQSRTISMIAEMASGAGHELNSPLTVIAGRAEMLAKDVSDPHMIRALETIREKAQECSEIVSELMEFAKPRPLSLHEFDLLELLLGCQRDAADNPRFANLQIAIQADGAASRRPPGTNAPEFRIRADADMLRRVVFALLANAADHPNESRPLAIVIELSQTASRRAYELRIRDNGKGMSAEVLKRAFDPFFSHRPAGRRRGLGLAQVHR
ncbi:MAG: HDOD domain-containing protein, partial [Phycisphaerae bacterium]